MSTKVREKEKAIALRKKGHTYREILALVPVSKSTVSAWLNGVTLTEAERELLKERSEKGRARGRARAKASLRALRERKDRGLEEEASKEFEERVGDAFFELGLGLYWATGAKRTGSFGFTNSDPEMVKLMLAWIKKFLKVPASEVRLRLYTQETLSDGRQEALWSRHCNIPISQFRRTVQKPQGSGVHKRLNLIGCVRIELGKVEYLRTMLFWNKMLIEHYRKQR